MEDLLEENKQQEIHLSDKEIFTKIWMTPRLVFKFINDKNYTKFITVLLILAGITSSLNRASGRNMGEHMSLISVLLICLIGGGIFGWLSFYIYAALLSWTGKWLKGVGNTKSLFRMIAYAFIPSLVILFILTIRIVLFGNDEFQSNVYIYDKEILTIVVYAFSVFIEIAIGVWTLAILVIGISEVQKLSISKSILNLILPGLLLLGLLIPVGLIAFIFGDLLN